MKHAEARAHAASNPDQARLRQWGVTRSPPLLALLAAAALVPLAGCLADQETKEEPLPQAQPIEFEVFTPNGGLATIAGLMWRPAQELPTSGLLLLHGASGVKENYWGELPVPGYSTGAWHAAQGRLVVAIDRPGYGESALPAGAVTSVEDEAFILDQIAGYVRSLATDGHANPAVAALGVSMGAFMATVTQGLYGSFDAIAPLAWAHHAMSDDAKACLRGPVHVDGGPCPEAPLDDFHMANADAWVAEAVVAGYQAPPAGVLAGFMAWQNAAWAVHGDLEPASAAPSLYDAAAARVTVPVLVLVGEQDWYIDASAIAGEGDYYGAGATVATIPDTGHMIMHHLNHDAVQQQVHAWLERFAL